MLVLRLDTLNRLDMIYVVPLLFPYLSLILALSFVLSVGLCGHSSKELEQHLEPATLVLKPDPADDLDVFSN